MSDAFKVMLAFNHAYNDMESKDYIDTSTYITKETLDKYFYNIFSSDVSYDTNNLSDDLKKVGARFTFKDGKFYVLPTDCQNLTKLYKKVINAKKSNKRVEIYEKVAYLVRDWFPSPTGEVKVDENSNISLGEINNFNEVNDDTMKPYLDKLHTYKYAFEYIEKDKAYKFVKVEKVQ